MTRRPPADAIERLAPYWHSVSLHEAGHAVATVRGGLKINHAFMSYRYSWLNNGWYVGGNVNWDEDENDCPDAILVACLAGAEAEAIACPNVTRRAVVKRCKEDRALSKAFLRKASIGRRAGERRARELVTAHWHDVERVAAALRKSGRLDARAMKALIS